MIDLMNDVRRERTDRIKHSVSVKRVRIFEQLYKEYINARPRGEAVPPLGDVYEMEPFALVASTPIDLSDPDMDPVTAESFADAFAQLPALSEAWWPAAYKLLATRFSGTVLRKRATVKDLDLARAVFDYHSVPGWRRFGARLTFHARTLHLAYSMSARPALSFFDMSMIPKNKLFSWKELLDALEHTSSDVACEVIRLCGLDPDVVTLDEMDDLGARLVCSCSSPSEDQVVPMDWRQSVRVIDSLNCDDLLTPPLAHCRFYTRSDVRKASCTDLARSLKSASNRMKRISRIAASRMHPRTHSGTALTAMYGS